MLSEKMRGDDGVSSVYHLLGGVIREALDERGFKTPTAPQKEAFPSIMRGENVLLIAPTGSGKTEAAVLPVFDLFLRSGRAKGMGSGISMLYITPLRALNRDLLRRLSFWSSRLGLSIEVRHGDTPVKERRRQALKPPDLLVTTPETLQAILPGERMRRHLRSIAWVIVDEVHELAQDKRGVQLTIALERLREITERDFQRIGLSATIGSPEEAAKFLGGTSREVKIIKVEALKAFKYHLEFPYPSEEDCTLAQGLYTTAEAVARITRIKELVDTHTSTLIFVNSRQHAEMLGSRLMLLEPNVAVHHGSLSREERSRVEEEFKQGNLKGIICTSTLELGIDIGTVDLVTQYMSPRQVSALIQRVGRAGHELSRVSEGIIISPSTDDILESLSVIHRAVKGRLEPLKIHFEALDVLAHQIAGLIMDKGWIAFDEALAIICRAYPYHKLSKAMFERVVKYLESLRMLRVERGFLRNTGRTRNYYYENISMIRDEKRYSIIDLTTNWTVGTLGDEFIQTRARIGLNFICKGRVWEIMGLSEEGKVFVTPIEDPTAAVPGWDGEILPVPFELAQEVGKTRAELAESLSSTDLDTVVKKYAEEWPAERYAVKKVVEEVKEQSGYGTPIPSHNVVVVEAFRNYIIVHACFGELVNRALGYIFNHILSKDGLIRGWWADGYRILLDIPFDLSEEDLGKVTVKTLGIPAVEALNAFQNQVRQSFPFSYYMKFVAERFGVIPRGRFNIQLPSLLETPVYDETLREGLQEKVDLVHAEEVFSRIDRGRIKVFKVLNRIRPSPLAYHILNKFVEVPELIAPESVLQDSVSHMKAAITSEVAALYCMSCWSWEAYVPIRELPEKPTCGNCGSGLLAILNKLGFNIREYLLKKRLKTALTEEELKQVARARRSADLVLSYGKKAAEALMVRGIGPQTASQILAKMHEEEEDFYKDLIQAKLRYLTTREYWGD